MSQSEYQKQWQRQLAREDIPDGHLPVYRWYLRRDDPGSVGPSQPPRGDLTIMRAVDPPVSFYRYLYHTAGEEYLWGDRRRMSDAELSAHISPKHILLMVLYAGGVPAGFYELSVEREAETHLKYFALLPGFTGQKLGSYMLNAAIVQVAERDVPLLLDTCTLDHPVALENYKARGFVVIDGQDEIYPDPRLDGTLPANVGKHLPEAVQLRT